MKVSISDKATIKQSIQDMYTKRNSTIVEDHKYYRDSAFSDTRFCFDLLAASLTNDQMRILYKSYNDLHLYTVTNQIVKELLDDD